jgi:hypothetical protein
VDAASISVYTAEAFIEVPSTSFYSVFFLEQLMLSGIFRRNHLQAADSFWLNQLITLHKCNLGMLACNVAVIHCDSKVLFF